MPGDHGVTRSAELFDRMVQGETVGMACMIRRDHDAAASLERFPDRFKSSHFDVHETMFLALFPEADGFPDSDPTQAQFRFPPSGRAFIRLAIHSE